MSCYNVFTTRRVFIQHLLQVHGQTLPYAGRFPVDLSAEDLRRKLQQLNDNQQRRPSHRPHGSTRGAPSATARGPGQEQEGPPLGGPRRGFRTCQPEPTLTPDQGPWAVMDHWPPTDVLHTRRVVYQQQNDTTGTAAPPTWQMREPDFSNDVLTPSG